MLEQVDQPLLVDHFHSQLASLVQLRSWLFAGNHEGGFPAHRRADLSASRFSGPVVLLGASLSSQDEPAFFRAIVRSSSLLGNLPMKILAAGAASMVKRIPASAERRATADGRGA